jgi:predicted transcriptional regulator
MTIVSSKEFISNEAKYFELALNERVFIRKGNNMFIVTTVNGDDDDDELLALAKSRKENGSDFTEVDDFINFLNQ